VGKINFIIGFFSLSLYPNQSFLYTDSHMDILKKISGYILTRFTKVQLALILVLIVCSFIISDSNIFTRFGYDMEIRNLKSQVKYYREKTVDDKAKLQELRSDKDNIEKFARENYKMKRDNEEVFIIE